MAANETDNNQSTGTPETGSSYRGPWGHVIRGMWRTSCLKAFVKTIKPETRKAHGPR